MKERRLLVFGALAAAAALGAFLYYRFGPIPDRYEPVGPFDIVTHSIRYLTGYNEGRIRFATTEQYSLRYRRRPFPIEGRAGMFGDTTALYRRVNAVVTFPGAEPAVVVNVGDPNNTSFYYLVREVGGVARVQYLGEGQGGVSAEWLDPPPGGGTTERNVALHRGRLAGGRWLLLGESAVLDVTTFSAYAVKPHPGVSLNQFKPVIAMSPDQRSFVRLGSGPGGSNPPVLVVFDFVEGSSAALPIDRRVMRFNDWTELDAAWFDYHFEWRREEGGPDRLAARVGVKPLAYRGRRYVDELDSTYHQYNLMRVSPAMLDTLAGFLERELRGRRQAPAPGGSLSFRIRDQNVNLLLHDDEVGLWVDRNGDPRLVDTIADRFDQVLATGIHDGLFLP